MEISSKENICQVCHQSLKPEYYFCPNCGAKLNQVPLSLSLITQIGIYAFSIVLPWILFVLISKWPGIKYLKSKDAKAKQIGIIACSLLALSTILTIWLAYVYTEQLVQSSINSINVDFSGL